MYIQASLEPGIKKGVTIGTNYWNQISDYVHDPGNLTK